jgi:ABC-2 type transport system ATP-binding protein
MIEVKNLKKSYGDALALKGISFWVQRGEIVGFPGPNGAGKTTAMKIITGYMAATDGTVVVDGVDVHENSMDVRKKIGYLPENAPLYQDMPVYEYLSYVASIREIPKNEILDRIAQIAKTCGILEVLHKDIASLSKGYRQRVGLAQAMIHNPPILILDEPTSGLDPNQIAQIRSLIKDIGKERTIILSTHNLPEVLATCNRIVIIHSGNIVADGTPADLEKKSQADPRTIVHFNAYNVSADDIKKMLQDIEGTKEVHPIEVSEKNVYGFEITARAGSDVRPDVVRLSIEKGMGLLELRRDVIDLEGLFRRLTL